MLFGLGLFFSIWLITRPNPFVFKDQLNTTIVSIDNTKITLQELSYYIIDVEAYVNTQALTYNPDNPKDYWNTHFSAGDNSAFVYAAAREQVYESCVSDYLYAMEAKKAGFALTERQIKTAETEAREIFEGMTAKQVKATELNLENLKELHIRETLASAYAAHLAETLDWSKVSDTAQKELSFSGKYFQEHILAAHKIKLDKKTWSKVIMGSITIN